MSMVCAERCYTEWHQRMRERFVESELETREAIASRVILNVRCKD